MPDSELKQRYPQDKWDGKASYLANARILIHNADYMEFLVTKVWKLDRPCRVVDFGCGSGRFGQMLMPLLPEGSTYTGFDQSYALVEEGRRLFEGTAYCAEFLVSGVYDVPFADSHFDIAVSQAVLMHIPAPMSAIKEMIRVTRHGGMVITCDANRNAVNAMIHTDELDTQDTSPIELFQRMNHEIRLRTGVDHNIGIKTPVLMHRAGLRNVQARVSDRVSLVLPPLDTDDAEAVFHAICDDGYGPALPDDEQRANWKSGMVAYGISEEDAEKEIERELAMDFRGKGRCYHTVYPSLLSFSFGTVDKGCE